MSSSYPPFQDNVKHQYGLKKCYFNSNERKEEGLKRIVDTDDNSCIMVEIQKYAYSLTYPYTDLINIVNRKVADDSINVGDAELIGEK